MKPTTEKPEIRDARGKLRSQFQTIPDSESLTVQSDAESADIKNILKRHAVTGIGLNDALNLTEEMFPDVSELGDFQDVMLTAKKAEAQFMKLPSKTRELFNHDVATWLDTAHDPEKRAQLLGEGGDTPIEQPTPSDPPHGGNGNDDPKPKGPPKDTGKPAV